MVFLIFEDSDSFEQYWLHILYKTLQRDLSDAPFMARLELWALGEGPQK